jgi:hypothetical protein
MALLALPPGPYRREVGPELYRLCLPYPKDALNVSLFIAAGAIFSYLAAVDITGDRAANLDLCYKGV